MITGPVVLRIALEPGILTEVATLACAFAGYMFLSILGHEFRLAIENAMGRVVTEVQKKRLGFVPFNKLDRLMVETVCEIFFSP